MTITTAQAEHLTAWLRDVRSIAARLFYQNRTATGGEWVLRWIGQLIDCYAAGATPAEAAATCRPAEFSPLRMQVHPS